MQLRKIIRTPKPIKFLKAIGTLLALQKENKELLKRNKNQQHIIKELQTKLSDPRLVINNVFKKGIKYFDAEELSKNEQRKYYQECQTILESRAFNNIKNYLTATITQESVKGHNPQDGLDRVRDAQMTINGIELLTEEFNDFPNPDEIKKKVNEDVNQMLNY